MVLVGFDESAVVAGCPRCAYPGALRERGATERRHEERLPGGDLLRYLMITDPGTQHPGTVLLTLEAGRPPDAYTMTIEVTGEIVMMVEPRPQLASPA